MRVQEKRWGEVTIKKQGEGKNNFDKTKSFSIEQTDTNYTAEQYWEILKVITNLTNKIPFSKLKNLLEKEIMFR